MYSWMNIVWHLVWNHLFYIWCSRAWEPQFVEMAKWQRRLRSASDCAESVIGGRTAALCIQVVEYYLAFYETKHYYSQLFNSIFVELDKARSHQMAPNSSRWCPIVKMANCGSGSANSQTQFIITFIILSGIRFTDLVNNSPDMALRSGDLGGCASYLESVAGGADVAPLWRQLAEQALANEDIQVTKIRLQAV